MIIRELKALGGFKIMKFYYVVKNVEEVAKIITVESTDLSPREMDFLYLEKSIEFRKDVLNTQDSEAVPVSFGNFVMIVKDQIDCSRAKHAQNFTLRTKMALFGEIEQDFMHNVIFAKEAYTAGSDDTHVYYPFGLIEEAQLLCDSLNSTSSDFIFDTMKLQSKAAKSYELKEII